jgi:hypothetical protein
MPVYIRTAAGTAAALNPLTKLPRHIRQLLVSIDGSTPTSTFALRMAKEGDIDVLLEVLQRAGLIRPASPAGARHGDAAAASPAVEAAGSPVLEVAQPPPVLRDIVSRLTPLEPPVAQASLQSDCPADSPPPSPPADANRRQVDAEPGPLAAAAAGSALLDAGFASFGSETAPAGLRPAGAVYSELVNVISLMSDFVTQHLPERSLEIVLALEGLTSVAQVRSSLDDYRALIAPMGDAAEQHLAELQRMLEAA